VSADLFQSVDQKICERWRFTITELPCDKFPQISRILLYKIIIVRLGYRHFCARRVPKILMCGHKMQRMASSFTFLQRKFKDGDESLNHIVRAIGDEICVSFLNVEPKEQSKQWMHTHSANKPKRFKQTSARKAIVNVFWDRKGVMMVGSRLQNKQDCKGRTP
jgi:hypothetical protein